VKAVIVLIMCLQCASVNFIHYEFHNLSQLVAESTSFIIFHINNVEFRPGLSDLDDDRGHDDLKMRLLRLQLIKEKAKKCSILRY